MEDVGDQKVTLPLLRVRNIMVYERMMMLAALAVAASGNNCSLTPPSARANFCNGGGCQCWCSPGEGVYTIWQYDPFTPSSGVPGGGTDSCCYDPTSDPPCFMAKPIVSNTLGSHMVLQSAPRAAQVYGWGTPRDSIIVQVLKEDGTSIDSNQERQHLPLVQNHSAVVGNDSAWVVQLTPMPASNDPYTIRIWSTMMDDGVHLHDILFGELWMCGGPLQYR
jgi:hypothetical protein